MRDTSPAYQHSRIFSEVLLVCSRPPPLAASVQLYTVHSTQFSYTLHSLGWLDSRKWYLRYTRQIVHYRISVLYIVRVLHDRFDGGHLSTRDRLDRTAARNHVHHSIEEANINTAVEHSIVQQYCISVPHGRFDVQLLLEMQRLCRVHSNIQPTYCYCRRIAFLRLALNVCFTCPRSGCFALSYIGPPSCIRRHFPADMHWC